MHYNMESENMFPLTTRPVTPVAAGAEVDTDAQVNSVFEDWFQQSNPRMIDSPDDWVGIEAKPNRGEYDTQYYFQTSDGTVITLDDISEVQILENKETSEILIIGANGAKVTGSQKSNAIYIYDSDIVSIDAKGGDDLIYVENSTVGAICGNKGDDKVFITDNSNVTIVDGGDGDDAICVAANSVVGDINAAGGDNMVIVSHSEVDKIWSYDGEDSVVVANESTVNDISTKGGSDKVVISDSTVGNVDSGAGDDTVNVYNSEVKKLKTKGGVDDIVIYQSEIDELDSGAAVDRVSYDTSSYIGDTYIDNDNLEVVTQALQFNPEDLDPETIEMSRAIVDGVVARYTDRTDLTPEERMQVLAIDFFNQNYMQMRSQYQALEDNGGVVNDGYNFVKSLLDCGVTKEDVEAALAEQQQMVTEMTAAINGEGNLTFEEVFQKYTGIEYDEDNMKKYLQNEQIYQFAATGMVEAQGMAHNILDTSQDMDSVLFMYTDYYGSEELGRQKINEHFARLIEEQPDGFKGIESIVVTEDNRIITTYVDLDEFGHKVDGTQREVEQDLRHTPNIFREKSYFFDGSYYADDFSQSFKDMMGFSIETAQNNYAASQLETFGRGMAFQKLVDKYCLENVNFIDDLTKKTRTFGQSLTIAGTVVTLFNPAAGQTMKHIGTGITGATAFMSEGLHYLDLITSENGQQLIQQFINGEPLDPYVMAQLDAIIDTTVIKILTREVGGDISKYTKGLQADVLEITDSKIEAMIAGEVSRRAMRYVADFCIQNSVDFPTTRTLSIMYALGGLAGL